MPSALLYLAIFVAGGFAGARTADLLAQVGALTRSHQAIITTADSDLPDPTKVAAMREIAAIAIEDADHD